MQLCTTITATASVTVLEFHINVAFHGHFDAAIGVVVSLEGCHDRGIPTIVIPLELDGIVRLPRGGELAVVVQGSRIGQGKIASGRHGWGDGILGKGVGDTQLFLFRIYLHTGGSVGISDYGIGTLVGNAVGWIEHESAAEGVQTFAQLDLVDRQVRSREVFIKPFNQPATMGIRTKHQKERSVCITVWREKLQCRSCGHDVTNNPSPHIIPPLSVSLPYNNTNI